MRQINNEVERLLLKRALQQINYNYLCQSRTNLILRQLQIRNH